MLRNFIVAAVLAVAVIKMPRVYAAVGRQLLQGGGDKCLGNTLDNCSGYSTQQALQYAAQVVATGSVSGVPDDLLIGQEPTNCPVNGDGGGGATMGRRRRLLQTNKICAGLLCLYDTLLSKYGAPVLDTPAALSSTVFDAAIAVCNQYIDSYPTQTVGVIFNALYNTFPAFETLDCSINTVVAPYCALHLNGPYTGPPITTGPLAGAAGSGSGTTPGGTTPNNPPNNQPKGGTQNPPQAGAKGAKGRRRR